MKQNFLLLTVLVLGLIGVGYIASKNNPDPSLQQAPVSSYGTQLSTKIELSGNQIGSDEYLKVTYQFPADREAALKVTCPEGIKAQVGGSDYLGLDHLDSFCNSDIQASLHIPESDLSGYSGDFVHTSGGDLFINNFYVRLINDSSTKKQVSLKLSTRLRLDGSVIEQPVVATVTVNPSNTKTTFKAALVLPENPKLYFQAMERFTLNGEGTDPRTTTKFIKKSIELPLSSDGNYAKVTAQAVLDAISDPSYDGPKEKVLYAKTVGDTQYVVLLFDVDGWAGVGMELAIEHSLIEKTLLASEDLHIKKVVFAPAPGDKAVQLPDGSMTVQ